MDSTSGAVIQASEVKEKLQSNHNDLQVELEKVFGSDLEIKVEEGSGTSEDSEGSGDSNEGVVIALSVLLAVSVVGLIVLLTVYLVRMKKMKKGTDSDRESFDIGRPKLSSIDRSFHFNSKKQEVSEVNNSTQNLPVSEKEDEDYKEVKNSIYAF